MDSTFSQKELDQKSVVVSAISIKLHICFKLSSCHR